MIQIRNDFLPKDKFDILQLYTKVNEFKITKAGDKEFSTLDTPQFVLPYLRVPGHEIILTFIRNAYKGFDDELRIHADHIIAGHKTQLASVLYINDPENVTPNGTAFWKHHEHGYKLHPDTSPEEFDRLLTEDSNDESKWLKTDFISNVPNRFLLYDSNLFHSKHPKEITEGTRIVLVIFYKSI